MVGETQWRTWARVKRWRVEDGPPTRPVKSGDIPGTTLSEITPESEGDMSVWWDTREYCRCCSTDMGGSDHCPECYCERYNERPDCEPDRTYRVEIFTNEDSRFCEAEPQQRLAYGGTLVVKSESVKAALEAAWTIANRMGVDTRGVGWSKYVRSASVGDVFLISVIGGDNPTDIYSVASVGFTEHPGWAIARDNFGWWRAG